MHTKFFFAIIALLLIAPAATYAQTQTEEHPFEVGGQLALVHLKSVESIVTIPGNTFRASGDDVTTAGFGGRVGYNVNRYLTLEAEFNHLPEKNINEVSQSRREQFLGGVKAGVRYEKVGVFAKARPGVMHFSELQFHTVCGAASNANGFTCNRTSQTNFAFDAGGVVEFYPTSRFIVRIDAGDTIIRFKEAGPTSLPGSSVFTPAATTHNLQTSVGLGFRF